MKILQVLVLIFGLTVFANAQKADLSGKVYDAVGALIVNAKITAINEKGEKFISKTDNNGKYILSLPFNQYDPKSSSAAFKVAKYEIEIDGSHLGFEKVNLKDFKFVPSFEGQMNLDFALDSVNLEPCGYSGAECLQDLTPVETTKTKISKKIRDKPLIKKGNN